MYKINKRAVIQRDLDLPVRALNKKKWRLRTAIPQYKAFLKRREPELGSCLICEETEKDVKNTKTKLIFLYQYTGFLFWVIRVEYTVGPSHKRPPWEQKKVTVVERFKLACSRLRDSGEKSFSKRKCEKRAGAGERPPPPPLPSRARLIFALLALIRPHYTIWEPGTG